MNRTGSRLVGPLVLVAGAVPLLSGCMHVPEPPAPAPPIELPETFTATTISAPGELASGPWWERFDSPALSSAVETALAANPEVEAIAARIDQAAAQARVAGADLRPRASAAFDASRRRQNFLGFPIPGAEDRVLSTTVTTLAPSLSLSWEIDLWGRIRAGRAASEASYRATAAEAEAATLSLAGQTARAWIAWREALAQVGLAERTVENRERTLAGIERRLLAGLVPAVDLRRARSELATSRSELTVQVQIEAAASRRLQALLGSYPDGRPEGEAADEDHRAPSLPAVPPPIPAGLPGEILFRRPDLVAAEERLLAAGYRIHEARAARLPSLRLTGSGGRSSTDLEDLLDSDFTVWSVAASLLQPIFEGGRLEANVELAEGRRREAAARWASTVIQALSEVETALAADGELAARAAALEEARGEAVATVELARRRHLGGMGDYLARLEAERALTEIETRLLAVHRARLENRVELHLALGGDFRESAARAPAAVDSASPIEQEAGS